jgi:hypothetical protein
MVIALFLLASATSAAHAQAPDAQSASNASDETNAIDAKNTSAASDMAKASDARSASGGPARANSDAAAKRQAKTAAKAGDDAAKADGDAAAKDEVKTLSGISILGNQEAPKSLVIVPWKSSEIGDMPGLSRLLDDGVQPIDKEVFMRELDYYEIRSSSR